MMDSQFLKLLAYFPEANLPFTLQEGSEHDFGLANDQLPSALLEEMLMPNLPFELDEFTEILPGFHWKTPSGGYILVFWVARLMKYSFILFSFDETGKWVDDAEVAGFFTEGNHFIRRMANIDDPQTIYIVEGVQFLDGKDIRPQETSKWIIEVMPNGQFIQLDAE
ncbi:MAG: hypothetical protein JNK69_08620 [Saprospiraceae bacterium]|nr:hypothetical protein [Candidatus Vicinibacter proximus]MBL7823458.1 hypothetical protein [Saprospiraceae bacterium]MCC6842489.1 hypothetical protein [Saprospiraceae bacterium]